MVALELDSIKEVESQSLIKMRKMLPFLDFNLLREAQKSRIKGVYGFFIEFVEIDENLGFAY